MLMPPTKVPSVALVEAAPLASVIDVAGLNDAEPVGITLQVTCTPGTGCPFEPSATKLSGKGSVAPVGAVWPSPATPVTDATCGPGPVPLPPHAAAAPIIAARATGTTRPNLFMVPPFIWARRGRVPRRL